MPPRARPATAADCDAVAGLWVGLLAEHAELDPHYRLRGDPAVVCARAVRALLDDGEAGLFVVGRADAGGAAGARAGLSGFVCTRVEAAPRELAERARAEISELYVHPDARRGGSGRALVDAALDWARSRGADRSEVRVHAHNAGALAFWRALGFGEFVAVLARRL